MTGSVVIVADGPTGALYAAVDASARYVTPAVASMRLGALLAPYPSADDARAALVAAGGKLRDGGQ